MKILLTGGGTGGHFYPLIAVAEQLNALAKENKLLEAKIYYMAPVPFDNKALYENNIQFVKMSAGKARRYFSLLNVLDIFKTFFGTVTALIKVFVMYPDVIFAKGGYVSFPVLLAGRILRIPIVIHESDTVPGRTNMWAGKFAERIAVSYAEAGQYFEKSKVALTGNPVRKNIMHPVRTEAYEFIGLEQDVPVILIVGGSLGSQTINEHILNALPKLVEKYQVIHQTGLQNFKGVKEVANIILRDSDHKNRYKPYDYLNDLTLRMSAGAASIVISRAGSSIFELASWGIPAILIPITDSQGDHQRKNAYAYARTGAAVVIEESNLSSNIIISEIDRLMTHQEIREKMTAAAHTFFKDDAAKKIATEIINIALTHEQ